MTERKSSRSRKAVDYSKFSRAGDSDDDFAEPTPPPSKKQRTNHESKPKNKSSNKVSSSREKRRLERIPTEEKDFEKELHMAMEMSRIDSQQSAPSFIDSQEVAPPVIDRVDATVVIDSQEADPPLLLDSHATTVASESSEDVGPTRFTVTADITPRVSDNKENQPKTNVRVAKKLTSSTQETDEIVVLEENVGSPTRKGRGQRRAADKASCQLKVTSESDSDSDAASNDTDFKLTGKEAASESESEDEILEDDDDDDSDFGESETKSKTKGKTQNKKRIAKTTTPKPRPATAKTAKKTKSISTPKAGPVAPAGSRPSVRAGLISKSASSSTAPACRSPSVSGLAVKSPLAGVKSVMRSPALAAARKPAWTPPAPAGMKSALASSSVKSPGGTLGVLRPGLSRNARLKPLHSSVKVPN